MTRDFNKPRREDSQSSFRNSSSNRNRDERSPRQARPRLNRETVDRAWESGAQQQHADYHPRTNGSGGQGRPQGQRERNWDSSSNRQGYSSQNERGTGRPQSNNRYDNFRDQRSSSYRDDRSGRDNRSSDRSYGNGNSNEYRSERPSYGQSRPNSNGRQNFEDRRGPFNGPNQRNNDDRQYSQNRENPGNFDRNGRDSNRNSYGSNGANANRGTSHPRWQSRPSEQREFRQENPSNNSRYEGDYEYSEERGARQTRSGERSFGDRDRRTQQPSNRSFEGRRDNFQRSETRTPDEHYTRESRDSRDSRDTRPPRPADRPFSGSRSMQNKSEQKVDEAVDTPIEKHVTRLPDGRVLKGPRPTQRKNAQFWTDVSSEKDELLNNVHAEPEVRATPPTLQTQDEQSVQEVQEVKAEKRPRKTTSRVSKKAVAPEAAINEMADTPPNTEIVAPSDTEVSTAIGDENATPEVPVGSSESESSDESSILPAPKRRARTASAVTRAKKTRVTTGGPTKPSQRGFKWPTQEQE